MSCTRDTAGPRTAAKLFSLATGEKLTDAAWHKAVAEADLSHRYDEGYNDPADPEAAYQRMLLTLAVEGVNPGDASPAMTEYLNAIRSGDIPLSNRHMEALINMRYAARGDYDRTRTIDPGTGRETLTYPDGRVVTIAPNGDIYTREANGDVRTYEKDSGVTTHASSDGTAFIDAPGQPRVYVRSDGRREYTISRGRDDYDSVIEYPDGVRRVESSATGHTVTEYPDGRRREEIGWAAELSTNGGMQSRETHPDGTVYETFDSRYSDGLLSRETSPDGTTRERRDGEFYRRTTITRYPNGDVRTTDARADITQHADGFQTVHLSGGSSALHDEHGNPVPTSRMERLMSGREIKPGRTPGES